MAVTAEFLVSSIDGLTESGTISKEWVGLILLPIVGNAAEHVTAVTVSVKDKLDLSIGVVRIYFYHHVCVRLIAIFLEGCRLFHPNRAICYPVSGQTPLTGVSLYLLDISSYLGCSWYCPGSWASR